MKKNYLLLSQEPYMSYEILHIKYKLIKGKLVNDNNRSKTKYTMQTQERILSKVHEALESRNELVVSINVFFEGRQLRST